MTAIHYRLVLDGALEAGDTGTVACPGTLALTGTPPLTIAAGAGSGKVATSDGSGNLSWATAASLGTLSLSGGDLGGSASVPTVTATHLASALPVNQGGTAATTAAAALTSLGAAALAGATYTGWTAPAVVALSDGATIATNAALGNDFRVTLAGNRTISNPTNPVDGQRIIYQFTQDATGSRTLTFGTAFGFGTAGAPTLTTTAAKTDLLRFVYNATASKWLFESASLGF